MVLSNDKILQTPPPAQSEPLDPPVYSPPAQSSRPPVNHLYISERTTSINGTWNLDPTLHIPPSLRPPLEEGEKLKNLKFVSEHGTVKGVISLIGHDDGAKASIEARSISNTVHIEIIRQRPTQRFSMTAFSQHRHVTVKIPHDFRGPIVFRNIQGSTKFSKGIEQKLTPFSKDGDVGRAFIGDWQSVGDMANWDGDELDVGSDYGTVDVLYNGEKTDSEVFWETWKEIGFFGMLLRWISGEKEFIRARSLGAGPSTSTSPSSNSYCNTLYSKSTESLVSNM